MLIDCDSCAARGPACGDCVVTVLLGAPPARESDGGLDLDGAEQAAIAVLAGSGLVPPLRLVTAAGGVSGETATNGDEADIEPVKGPPNGRQPLAG